MSLNQYLSDIAKIPMITPQEEGILTQKIREGDQAALERLTTANLRFVVSVAKQYQSSGLRQSILSAIGEQSRMVRLPLNQVGDLSKIAKSASRLEQVYERQPTAEELAEDLGTTVEKVSNCLLEGGR